MTVTRDEDLSNRSRCFKCFWRLFPHVFLILSLILYAALGAFVFQKIEGERKLTAKDQQLYREFVYNLTDRVNSTVPGETLFKEVDKMLRKDLKAIWLQHPARWTFSGSLFFCCTVITTVGYGEIYPVTLPGRVVCILYAMVGIPLTLLVITDVGDLLARVFSQGYLQAHTFLKLLLRRLRRRRGQCPLMEGTYTFNHEVVVRKPLDIKQVMLTQASVKRKSLNLLNNMEIFERIIAREKMNRTAPLLRSRSCPELNRASDALWDLGGIGGDMERLNVPLVLLLLVVFAFVFFGSRLLRLWETDFGEFDSFYFCFITLTTIGFGDIVPSHPKYFMLTFLFLISGMAIMSMVFKLGQSTIISCYRQCMRYISRGRVKYEVTQED